MTPPQGRLHLLPCALGPGEWPRTIAHATREAAVAIGYFIVENARSARAWLKCLEHPIALRDLHIEQLPEQPNGAQLDALLSPLAQGTDAGLLSEAGCPAIADPGAALVREAHRRGIGVVPHVGPSSILLALMASGLDGQRFVFHGYLPIAEPQRLDALRALEADAQQHRRTQIFIEAPYRNARLFEAILSACRPTTLLCVACDLTLPTELVRTASIASWRAGAPPDLQRRPTVFLLLA